jgi:hypothetical protein
VRTAFSLFAAMRQRAYRSFAILAVASKQQRGSCCCKVAVREMGTRRGLLPPRAKATIGVFSYHEAGLVSLSIGTVASSGAAYSVGTNTDPVWWYVKNADLPVTSR